jgi:alkanesulfonate monooxygenase SsuD/methylene tetrahydromethanopterin reductase-like flavin-dependent oxidoreductase (luciferase family)
MRLGLNWSEDEFIVKGASMKESGVRAEEFLEILRAIWTTDPVEYQVRFFQIQKFIIRFKPAQKPHPPIHVAAFVEKALRRDATPHRSKWW